MNICLIYYFICAIIRNTHYLFSFLQLNIEKRWKEKGHYKRWTWTLRAKIFVLKNVMWLKSLSAMYCRSSVHGKNCSTQDSCDFSEGKKASVLSVLWYRSETNASLSGGWMSRSIIRHSWGQRVRYDHIHGAVLFMQNRPCCVWYSESNQIIMWLLYVLQQVIMGTWV